MGLKNTIGKFCRERKDFQSFVKIKQKRKFKDLERMHFLNYQIEK